MVMRCTGFKCPLVVMSQSTFNYKALGTESRAMMSELYSNVFRALPGLACLLNPSLLLCDANTKFLNHFRLSPVSILTTKVQDIFEQNMNEMALATVILKLSSDECHEFDVIDMESGEGKSYSVVKVL